MSTIGQTLSIVTRTLLLVAAAAMTSAPAWAQPASPIAQSIEVTAPRADVRTVCRGVDEQLQEMLGSVAWREAMAGTIEVRFEIDGARVAAVHTSGGPLAYRTATHRALHRLQCRTGAQGRRSVRMQVVFLDPGTAAQHGRVAVTSRDELAQR